MKLIQRYHSVYRSPQAAAGVYYVSVSSTLTTLFNLIVNSVSLGYVAYDDVTDQFIDSVGQFSVSLPIADPGLSDTGARISPSAHCRGGDQSEINVYSEVAAGGTFGTSLGVFLASVTANPININARYIIGYLCPEDYLSVDGFASQPA